MTTAANEWILKTPDGNFTDGRKRCNAFDIQYSFHFVVPMYLHFHASSIYLCLLNMYTANTEEMLSHWWTAKKHINKSPFMFYRADTFVLYFERIFLFIYFVNISHLFVKHSVLLRVFTWKMMKTAWYIHSMMIHGK